MNETAPARIDFRNTVNHAQGLGAVWVGVYPEQSRMENFRTLLGIPETVIRTASSPSATRTWPPAAWTASARSVCTAEPGSPA